MALLDALKRQERRLANLKRRLRSREQRALEIISEADLHGGTFVQEPPSSDEQSEPQPEPDSNNNELQVGLEVEVVATPPPSPPPPQ